MSKNLTKKQWIEIIKIYKNEGENNAIKIYLNHKPSVMDISHLKQRIRLKSNLVDNNGMKTLNRVKGSGRPKQRDDSDIPDIIDELTEIQKREILEHWIKEQRDKKSKNNLSSYKTINTALKAKIMKMHKT